MCVVSETYLETSVNHEPINRRIDIKKRRGVNGTGIDWSKPRLPCVSEVFEIDE